MSCSIEYAFKKIAFLQREIFVRNCQNPSKSPRRVVTGTFRKMPGLILKCCNNRVYAYASHNPLQVVGCCDVKMSVNGGGHVNTANVLVVKGDNAALLGRKTAEQIGVLRVGLAENV